MRNRPVGLGLAGLVLGGLLFAASGRTAAQAPPASAINDPDAFAWTVFQDLNADAGTGDGRVVWETWKSANNTTDVFLPNGATPPPWPVAGGSSPTKVLSGELLQESMRRKQGGLPAPQFDPNVGTGNEVRMNRPAFEFVLRNELFHVAGQIQALTRPNAPEFPPEAREVKAQWRRLTPQQDPARFHIARIVRNGVAETWGLTALHITTKDMPNWFWATFEHADNPGRELAVPSRDRHGLPPTLNGTKWANYVLRGSQVNFTTSTGVPTVLANSQIEAPFQTSSSCVTCHSRASIDTNGNHLDIFAPGALRGFTGTPIPAWFAPAPQNSVQKFFQTDFVWSLIRAQRRP